MVQGSEGFVMFEDGETVQLPVFPHRDLASTFVTMNGIEGQCVSVSLEEFTQTWLPGLEKNGVELVMLRRASEPCSPLVYGRCADVVRADRRYFSSISSRGDEILWSARWHSVVGVAGIQQLLRGGTWNHIQLRGAPWTFQGPTNRQSQLDERHVGLGARRAVWRGKWTSTIQWRPVRARDTFCSLGLTSVPSCTNST